MRTLIVSIIALVAMCGSDALKAQYGPLPGGGGGGSSIKWRYETATRTLTLTGYGRNPDYSAAHPAPWAVRQREIEKIEIGSGVTIVGDYAFAGCTALTSVKISESVTEIKDGAFSGCTALSSLALPANLRRIGRDAFAHCSALTTVSLPESVTEIGRGAFSNCAALRSVTVAWPVPLALSQPIFQSVPLANVRLNVPRGTSAVYRTAPVWSEFQQIYAVANVEIAGRQIYAADGVLYLSLSQPALVRVYDLSGRLLLTHDAPSGSSTLRLMPGYHVVQVGDSAEKVWVGN